jgi:hypothetical protein
MIRHFVAHARIKRWRKAFGPIGPDGSAANVFAVINHGGLILEHCEVDHHHAIPMPVPKGCEGWSMEDWHRALHEGRVPLDA